MKISVIVPVYNCEEFLPGCIDSILRQSHSDLEIILVDDGSVDGSGALCDEYARKDARIRVIHQENQGVSAARNAGLDATTGDWITFVDSDDTVEPDMYEVLLRLVRDHEVDIAICGYRKVYFDGSSKAISGTGVLLVQDAWEATECLLNGQYFTGSPWAKLYSKELFSDVRFDRSLKINEDVLMNVETFRRARKLAFWDVPKYCYYERKGSATRTVDRTKTKRDLLKVAQGIFDLYRNTKLEQTCAAKLYYGLLNLYREELIRDYVGYKKEREEIHNRIQTVTEVLTVVPRHSLWNYRFMRYLPWLYILTYRVFDRIRKPKTDL